MHTTFDINEIHPAAFIQFIFNKRRLCIVSEHLSSHFSKIQYTHVHVL